MVRFEQEKMVPKYYDAMFPGSFFLVEKFIVNEWWQSLEKVKDLWGISFNSTKKLGIVDGESVLKKRWEQKVGLQV